MKNTTPAANGETQFTGEAQPPWLDLQSIAHVRLTSEDTRHPIEEALRTTSSTGWRAALPGEQTIWISFHAAHPVRQINVGFEITERRTHEFVLSWSTDGGVTYREMTRQQFNFSSSTPREEENYFPNLDAVTDLKLAITPDISDGRAHAALKYVRLR